MAKMRWFHCILTTYGAWLPGDPRGFRTRHHREHVEGDYKSPPPPERYAARWERSKRLQKYPTVTLAPAEPELLGKACVCFLLDREIEIVSTAGGGQHVHLQFRCDKALVIHTLGEIKRHLWYVRKEAGNASRLWGRRRKIIPITSRSHQISVVKYVLRHRREGAWVWCWRDGRPL